MNCHSCNLPKISPKTQPFGGFICSNDHIQCETCNKIKDGMCQLCNTCTGFFSIHLSTSPSKIPEKDAEIIHVIASNCDQEEPPFPKAFFDGFEDETYETVNKKVPTSEEPTSINHEEQMQSAKEHDSKQIYATEVIYFTKTDKMIIGESNSQIGDNVIHTDNMSDTIHQFQPSHRNESMDQNNNNQYELQQNYDRRHYEYHTPKYQKQITNEDQYQYCVCEVCSSRPIQNVNVGVCLQANQKRVHIHENDKVIQVNTEIYITSNQGAQCSNLQNNSKLKRSDIDSVYEKQQFATVGSERFSSENEISDSDFRNSTSNDTLDDIKLINTANYINESNAGYESCSLSADDGGGDSQRTEQGAEVEKDQNQLFAENLIMHSTGMTPDELAAALDTGKIVQNSMDLRLQRVAETIREKPLQLTLSVRHLIDMCKLSTSVSQNSQKLEPESQREGHLKKDISSENTIGVMSEFISIELFNAYRCHYNPPSERIPYVLPCLNEKKTAIDTESDDKDEDSSDDDIENKKTNHPPPQFKLVNSKIAYNPLLLEKLHYIKLNPIPPERIQILRTPIECPESSCKRIIFVSDFVKHLTVDHSKVPLERISPHQCRNFFLDPNLAHDGVTKCNLLYLLRHVVTDLGNSYFRNYLPLMVMSTRIKLSQICNIDLCKFPLAQSNVEFLMIWLTGIKPENVPLSTALTVWSRSGVAPTCHITNAGPLYNIRNSQKIEDVWKSGNCLILSTDQIKLLTRNGKDLLEFQIFVH